MTTLIDQPTTRPTRKWTAERIAGAGSVVLVWAIELWGVQVPATVAVAFAVILGGAISYYARERGAGL